jgi:hypothetical protein
VWPAGSDGSQKRELDDVVRIHGNYKSAKSTFTTFTFSISHYRTFNIYITHKTSNCSCNLAQTTCTGKNLENQHATKERLTLTHIYRRISDLQLQLDHTDMLSLSAVDFRGNLLFLVDNDKIDSLMRYLLC